MIRHIATSLEGNVFAVAEFKHKVQIWDSLSWSRISSFPTTLDFGGDRLAISKDGCRCYVGAYHVHGIATYNVADGCELWRRRDLKKVQRIRVSLDDSCLFCGFEDRSSHLLDCETGDTISTLHGIADYYESPYDQVVLSDKKSASPVIRNKVSGKTANIRRTTFAILDVAFCPRLICISESGGPVRCLCVESGEEKWRFKPKKGHHVLELAYESAKSAFYGVCWPYEHGGNKILIKFDPDSGEIQTIVDIGDFPECAFCQSGSKLILSDGKVVNAANGALIEQLTFN